MNDTLRPDYLQPYGNDWVKTPNARKFAESAAVFDRAHVGSWATIPNRTDLFTGRFGEPIHPWLPLAYEETTLPQILGENGYVTQLICDTPHMIQGGHNFDYPFHAWQFIRGQEVDHFGMDHDSLNLPFEDSSKVSVELSNRYLCQYLRNVRGRQTEEDWATHNTYETAVRWLERNHKHEKFFLWIDGFDPHEPPWPPQHYIDMYDPGYDGDVFLTHIKSDALTEREIEHVKARYAGSVTFVDRNVGKVLRAIEDLGLADDTCVVWTSDHGTHIGEHGKTMGKVHYYDEISRIVMMVRVPGSKSVGGRFDDFVQPADLAPTVLELAGLDVPERMQGISFLPRLKGEEFETRKFAITGNAKTRPGQYEDWAIGARDGRWTFNAFALRNKDMLFDMDNDPQQLTNVVEENPEVRGRMREAVIEFLRTHDSQPQLIKFFETGDMSEMDGYVPIRPGYEAFRQYFFKTYNSAILPE